MHTTSATHQTQRPVSLRQQTGAALVIGLIFLLMLSLLGVASMRSTGLQERMASSFDDSNTAFQLAEVAVRAGEREVGRRAREGETRLPVSAGSCPTDNTGLLPCSGLTADDLECINEIFADSEPVPLGAVDIGLGSADFALVSANCPLNMFGSGLDEECADPSAPGANVRCPGDGGACMMILGRGTGRTGRSESVIQTIYCPPMLETIDAE